jgi:hypothetical protein
MVENRLLRPGQRRDQYFRKNAQNYILALNWKRIASLETVLCSTRVERCRVSDLICPDYFEFIQAREKNTHSR